MLRLRTKAPPLVRGTQYEFISRFLPESSKAANKAIYLGKIVG
jgi:hypothetical protein